MKCANCGYENEQDYASCPSCGAAVSSSPAAGKILCALRDPLFLVVCILLSAACLLSLTVGDVPLINILITVFLWLTYAQSRKGVADAHHLRSVSGALYAQYIIYYVAAGLVLVVGLICAVAFGVLGASMESFVSALLTAAAGEGSYIPLAGMLSSVSSFVILITCVIVSAIMVVVNIFTTRYLHGFARSVYMSVESGSLALKHVTAAKVLLFIYGGSSALGCLSSLGGGDLMGFLSGGAGGACAIIAGLLIRKYLTAEEPANA